MFVIPQLLLFVIPQLLLFVVQQYLFVIPQRIRGPRRACSLGWSSGGICFCL